MFASENYLAKRFGALDCAFDSGVFAVVGLGGVGLTAAVLIISCRCICCFFFLSHCIFHDRVVIHWLWLVSRVLFFLAESESELSNTNLFVVTGSLFFRFLLFRFFGQQGLSSSPVPYGLVVCVLRGFVVICSVQSSPFEIFSQLLACGISQELLFVQFFAGFPVDRFGGLNKTEAFRLGRIRIIFLQILFDDFHRFGRHVLI
mmetsp:Transcript_10364/g.30305  ORF Transcript_10364/g.30305 Transcript_10364/m.30305 type:complete len:203 (-) Transcript_10364:108-716(-)